MATTNAYRATGRQAPLGGPAAPGNLRSNEIQMPSEGGPTGHEHRSALAVGSAGERLALQRMAVWVQSRPMPFGAYKGSELQKNTGTTSGGVAVSAKIGGALRVTAAYSA